MKFIGQYIQSFIARFRNDVYLEDISTGTIASDGNLGLDSNNKIVKATSQDAVTLAGTPDYITISGQEITRNAIDLTTDVTGVLPSANLDADTAHLSLSKQLTHHMMVDDIDTTKIYIPLQTPDTENATATNKQLPVLAPFSGKLLKIFLRANTDLSGNTLTWRLETQSTSNVTAATPTIVGTQSGAGCTNRTMTTYDFTSSLDSGDNLIDAGDTVQISIQSDSSTANTRFHITLLWEWDLS
jgi:hypothetical protein